MLTFRSSKEYVPTQETLVQKADNNLPPKKTKFQKFLSWFPGSKPKADSYTALEDAPPASLKGRASRRKSQEYDEHKEGPRLLPLPPSAQALNGNISGMINDARILQLTSEGIVKATKVYLQVLEEPQNEQTESYKRTAARELGLIFEKSGAQENAIKYYAIAIDKGCTSSSYELALLLEERAEKRGEPHLSKNFKIAFHLLESVADHNSDATFALARFFEEGKGNQKNILEAKRLYERYAYSHKFSAYRLGRLHESGIEENGHVVIPQDLAQALKYYDQARLMHHPKAERAYSRLSRFLKQKNPEAMSRGYIKQSDILSPENRF